VIVAIIIVLLPWENVQAASELNAPAFPHVKRAGDTTLQLSWQKVPDADGYVVYRHISGKTKYKKVKTIKNGNTVKWTNKKLKKNTTYVYKIRAYKNMWAFSKEYSDYTYYVSARTYSRKSKFVNAGKSIKSEAKITVGIKESKTVSATVSPDKYGTAKKKKVINKAIRVFAANQTNVKIEKEHNIIGRKEGTANIYLIAHNGNAKVVKATVVDYAKPTEWMNLDEISPNIMNFIAKQYVDIVDSTSYFEQLDAPYGDILLDDNGKLKVTDGLKLGNMESTIFRLLSECPNDLSIEVSPTGIRYQIVIVYSEGIWAKASIYFNIKKDFSEEVAIDDGWIKIAPHWFYSMFLPI
jgi:hypothetical protein